MHNTKLPAQMIGVAAPVRQSLGGCVSGELQSHSTADNSEYFTTEDTESTEEIPASHSVLSVCSVVCLCYLFPGFCDFAVLLRMCVMLQSLTLPARILLWLEPSRRNS